MDFAAIQSRGDFIGYMSQSARESYLDPDFKEPRLTTTLMKSHIAEFQEVASDAESAWPSIFVQQHPIDRSLTRLVTADGTQFVGERLDSRFVAFHTIAKTVQSDNIIQKLTTRVNSAVDRAWLPSSFLLTESTGRLTGYKFAYNPVYHDQVDEPDIDGMFADFLGGADEDLDDTAAFGGRGFRAATIDPWKAQSNLRAIFDSRLYVGQRALDWIERVNHDDPHIWRRSTIYGHGKIVSRSVSAESHVVFTRSLAQKYGDQIRSIEDNYWIRWANGPNGALRQGEPILIRINERPIENLEIFASHVFSGLSEFRLIGYPGRSSGQRLSVEGVDLHRGDPVSFEITRDLIRLYLPQRSCGNVVCRFVSNLQRFYSSDIEVFVPSGEILFREGWE